MTSPAAPSAAAVRRMTPAQRRNHLRSVLAKIDQATELLTAVYEDGKATPGLSLCIDDYAVHVAVSRSLDRLDALRDVTEPIRDAAARR